MAFFYKHVQIRLSNLADQAANKGRGATDNAQKNGTRRRKAVSISQCEHGRHCKRDAKSLFRDRNGDCAKHPQGTKIREASWERRAKLHVKKIRRQAAENGKTEGHLRITRLRKSKSAEQRAESDREKRRGQSNRQFQRSYKDYDLRLKKDRGWQNQDHKRHEKHGGPQRQPWDAQPENTNFRRDKTLVCAWHLGQLRPQKTCQTNRLVLSWSLLQRPHYVCGMQGFGPILHHMLWWRVWGLHEYREESVHWSLWEEKEGTKKWIRGFGHGTCQGWDKNRMMH